MELIKVEIEVPKDLKEVVDLLGDVVGKLKAKAAFSSYADLIQELMVAVDGIGNIPEDVKAQYLADNVAYLSHKLVGALLAPAAPAAPTP